MFKVHFGVGDSAQGTLITFKPYEQEVEFEFSNGAKLIVQNVKQEIVNKIKRFKVKNIKNSEISLITGEIIHHLPEKMKAPLETSAGVIIDGKKFTQDIQGPASFVAKAKSKKTSVKAEQ